MSEPITVQKSTRSPQEWMREIQIQFHHNGKLVSMKEEYCKDAKMESAKAMVEFLRKMADEIEGYVALETDLTYADHPTP